MGFMYLMARNFACLNPFGLTVFLVQCTLLYMAMLKFFSGELLSILPEESDVDELKSAKNILLKHALTGREGTPGTPKASRLRGFFLFRLFRR